MKKKESRPAHKTGQCVRYLESPIGLLHLEADAIGITSLYIEGMCSDGRKRYMSGSMQGEMAADGSCKPDDVMENAAEKLLDQAVRELTEYFAGVRMKFTVPVHLAGTEFQLKAWNALRQIPYGETRSYSDIAQMIGNPKACRAVGGANNKNPVMLFVPCHRVVGKGGALVGFAGGLEAKQYLLRLEQGKLGEEIAAENVTENAAENVTETVTENAAQNVTEETGRKIAESVSGSTRKDDAYTLEDYYALPKEQRVELIDGVFYDMAAPTAMHQIAVSEIWFQIRSYIGEKSGNCIPFVSPVDVQLDCDDRTMVQPDVLVVCEQNKIQPRCIFGAPDLVIEVLSDSTALRDTGIKLDKYKNAGVREYWIVDLKRKRVLVYEFAKSGTPVLYGSDTPVPVGIFDGKLQIDFAGIFERVEFLQPR